MYGIDSKALTVFVVIALCGALIIGLALWLGPANEPERLTDALERTLPAPLTPEELAAYEATITNPMNPRAIITTSLGQVELELFEDTMPITAGNFIKLAEEGFYDGIKFHRVISGFVVQGGDPITRTDEVLRYGSGGPGYVIPDEHIVGEYLTNVRGTIAMANSGPETGGSQFFINLDDNTNLDFNKEPMSSKHPVFGRVIDGMNVVDAIGAVETNRVGMPLEDIFIEKVEIVRQ